MKNLTYTRDKTHWNNRVLEKQTEEIKIEIKPGYAVGQVLTYAGKGNEQFTYDRSALKIKIVEDKSVKTNFIRRGNDLVYMHSLSLQDAFLQKPVVFDTLDNR